MAALILVAALHGGACLLGTLLQALSARRPGWRVTLSAVAVLFTMAALVTLPTVALAQTHAELSGLSLSSGTLRPTFAATTTEYRAAVKHGVNHITVTPTAATGGTVEYLDVTDRTLDDANAGTTGFQVDLLVGETLFKVKVTRGTATKTYIVTVERDSAYAFNWTPTMDFNTLTAGNGDIAGLWGNSTTLYVSDSVDRKIYAYTRATRAYNSSQDIPLHADNANPAGIWSDDMTLWVADDTDNKLYAYTLSSKARDPAKEVTLTANNDSPTGIWGNATHIYVADGTHGATVYAYDKSTFMYDNSNDLAIGTNVGVIGAIDGIWSDGTTVWWTDHSRLFDGSGVVVNASRIVDGVWDSYKRIQLYTNRDGEFLNARPQRLWSDGETMWVADTEDDKLYSYTLGPSAAGETALSALTVGYDSTSAPLRPAFALGETSYRTAVHSGVSLVTITTTKNDNNSTLEYLDSNGDTLADVDSAPGFQMNVDVGATSSNVLDVKVTSSSGDALVYRVVVERDSDSFFGWTPTRDFNTLEAAGNLAGHGLWGNSSTVWVSDRTNGKLYAYNKSTHARDPGKDITLDSANTTANYVWSDGTTMWVVDHTKLFAL